MSALGLPCVLLLANAEVRLEFSACQNPLHPPEINVNSIFSRCKEVKHNIYNIIKIKNMDAKGTLCDTVIEWSISYNFIS